MQTIEIDRISSLEQLIKKLTIQLNLLAKKMTKVVEVFQSIQIDIPADIKTACKKHGTCQNEQEICLYDIYAENTKNMMNKDRRIVNLNKWSHLFEVDVKSQQNSLAGLIKVKNFAKENPNFNANNDADVNQKLDSVKNLKLLYESSWFKVKSALGEIIEPHAPKLTYEHSSLMSTIFDKQGVPITTLKLPVSFFTLSSSNNTSTTSNLVEQRPSAPSAPDSPTRSSSIIFNYPPGITNSILSSSSAYSSLNQNAAAIISMPMPQPYSSSGISSYDSHNSSSSFTNYAGIETSSTSSSSGSSISTNSSVSPAATLSSSNTSSNTPTQTDSPTQTFSYFCTNSNNNNNNNNKTPSFILTKSATNTKTLTNPSLMHNYDYPPSYTTATLKKDFKTNGNNGGGAIIANSNFTKHINDAIDPSSFAPNNNNNNKNNNNRKFIENHYNNSVQSSDGNLKIIFLHYI